MNTRTGSFLLIRIILGIIYFWVVADRLGFLGPAGNTGVVWGNFDTFLEYTATLNPWFPRAISDVLGYFATLVEVILAILLVSGLRLKEAALGSFALLLAFASSLILSIGINGALGFILFTVTAAGASVLLYLEERRKAELRSV